MSLDYLEELVEKINRGADMFAAPGFGENEWHVSEDVEAMIGKAQLAANAKGYDTTVYKLTTSLDMGGNVSYFVVRKLLEPKASGEPNIRWCIVDTKDAAEMLRDVSQGPTPFFGAMACKKCKPDSQEASY